MEKRLEAPIYLDGAIVMLGRDAMFGGFVEILGREGGHGMTQAGQARSRCQTGIRRLLSVSHSKTGIDAGVALFGPVAGERQDALRW